MKKTIFAVIIIIALGIGGFFYFTRQDDSATDDGIINNQLPEGVEVVEDGKKTIIRDNLTAIEVSVTDLKQNITVSRNDYASGFLFNTANENGAKIFVSGLDKEELFLDVITKRIEKGNEVSEIQENIMENGSTDDYDYVITIEDNGPLGKNYNYYIKFNGSDKMVQLISDSLDLLRDLSKRVKLL